jgi:hypothetical protein
MTDSEPDESLCEKELRAELGEIFDQLRTLPSDAFAEKVKLRKRQDELTRLLREIDIPGAEELKKDWAEAAAAKRFAEESVEMIVSPIESGGGGGA